MPNMGDLMAEYEAELLAKTQAEVAKEDAAWAALSPEEQARIIAEREAKQDRLYADLTLGDREFHDGPDDDKDEEDDPDEA